MAVEDISELLAYAERCVRDGATPVYEFVLALARARGVSAGRVLFGVCNNEGYTRNTLKAAEWHATRPSGQPPG